MLILMPFNFAFIIFSIGEPQNSQIEKKHFFAKKTCKCGFLQIVDSGILQLKKFRKQSWMPLKLASVRSVIYFLLLKSAEKCQFQNTRKLDASTPLHYPADSTLVLVCILKCGF